MPKEFQFQRAQKQDMKVLFQAIIILSYSYFLLCQNVETSTRSSKKGIVAPVWMRCRDFDKLSTISWWYNYHTYLEVHENKPDLWCQCQENIPVNSSLCYPEDPDVVNFIPMIWGEPGYGHQWNTNLAEQPEIKQNIPIFLGYNEPERQDQSNIPAEDAAMLFRELQARYPNKEAVRFVAILITSIMCTNLE